MMMPRPIRTLVGALAAALLSSAALAQTSSIATINIGANANDGTGDTLRVAFGKVNANFGLLGSAAFMPASAFAPAGSGGGAVSSVAGRTGAIVLTHSDISDWNVTLASYALTSSLGSAASQPSSAFDAAGAASTAQTAAVATAKTYTQGYLASLPTCTAGSSVAPVPTGSPFLCAGLVLIAQ